MVQLNNHQLLTGDYTMTSQLRSGEGAMLPRGQMWQHVHSLIRLFRRQVAMMSVRCVPQHSGLRSESNQHAYEYSSPVL